MEKQLFYQKLKELLEEMLGKNYAITLCQQSKIGWGTLDVIMIRKAKEKIAIVLYLQEYYEQFLAGTTINCLILTMLERYYVALEEQEQILKNSSLLQKKELLEPRLFFYCIPTKKNQELLKEIPHQNVLDLSLVCSLFISQKNATIASITITEKMMKTYGWTQAALFQKAKENTPFLFPEKLQSIIETLEESFKKLPNSIDVSKELQMVKEDSLPMMVISNHVHLYGFSAIFYPNVLQKLAEKEDKNLIIIPSSIHEALVLTDDKKLEAGKMNQMITEINQKQVREDERLSNRAYYYDRKRKELLFLSDYENGVYDLCVKF